MNTDYPALNNISHNVNRHPVYIVYLDEHTGANHESMEMIHNTMHQDLPSTYKHKVTLPVCERIHPEAGSEGFRGVLNCCIVVMFIIIEDDGQDEGLRYGIYRSCT